MANKDQKVESNVFAFNPHGGEHLILKTDFISNGNPGEVTINQEVKLISHCNSASFQLNGFFLSPEKLRDLANQLESQLIQAKLKTRHLVLV